MRWFWLLMFLGAGLASGQAERPFPPAVVPAEALTESEIKTLSLPAPLVSRLEKEDAFRTEDGALPPTLSVIRRALREGGGEDYLVREPSRYTGGNMYWIFSSEADGCVPWGVVQGWFYLVAPENGHFRIVAEGRAGGDQIVRTLLVFRDGQYREARAATYRQKGDDEVYVREEKPRD